MRGLKIINETSVPVATMARYREANLCLPVAASLPRKSDRLAIVGSGLSIRERFQEIADFNGEVWAINGAFGWLRDHGVEATFFSIDPLPIVGAFSQGARRVILASQCDPAVFGARIGEGAEICCIRREDVGGFSAVGAVVVALDCGFKEISLFGCECSFKPEAVHVDGRTLDETFIVVGVGDEEFLTRPAYYQQALGLSAMIGRAPAIKERSGGLLGALVSCFDPQGEAPETPWLDAMDEMTLDLNPGVMIG